LTPQLEFIQRLILFGTRRNRKQWNETTTLRTYNADRSQSS